MRETTHSRTRARQKEESRTQERNFEESTHSISEKVAEASRHRPAWAAHEARALFCCGHCGFWLWKANSKEGPLSRGGGWIQSTVCAVCAAERKSTREADTHPERYFQGKRTPAGRSEMRKLLGMVTSPPFEDWMRTRGSVLLALSLLLHTPQWVAES